jgi:ABC-type amino acid transport substrate-binding protein
MSQLSSLAKSFMLSKKCFLTLLIGLGITLASNAATNPSEDSKAPEDYTTIMEKGRIRVGVQNNAKPFYYFSKGQPTGFNYEFLQLILSQTEFTNQGTKIRLNTDIEADTYEEVPLLLKSKNSRGDYEVDLVIDGLTFVDDEVPGVVYSAAYISDFGYSVIAPNRSGIQNVDDLAGKKIGILKGDPDVKAYAERRLNKSQLIELSDATINGQRTWIKNALDKKVVDVIIYDYPFAVAEIDGTDLVFAISKLPDTHLRYKIGVRKTSPVLLQNLNSAINKVKNSNEYYDLLKKYFFSNKVTATAAKATEASYIVKKGDTLSLIAQKTLGNKLLYTLIESRNNLPNPNLIEIGQKLIIPKI